MTQIYYTYKKIIFGVSRTLFFLFVNFEKSSRMQLEMYRRCIEDVIICVICRCKHVKDDVLNSRVDHSFLFYTYCECHCIDSSRRRIPTCIHCVIITLVSSSTELRFSTQTVSTGPSSTIQNQALACSIYGGFESENDADLV
jgi:hypothetical protein